MASLPYRYRNRNRNECCAMPSRDRHSDAEIGGQRGAMLKQTSPQLPAEVADRFIQVGKRMLNHLQFSMN
jgi:hypothetical protein